MNNDTKLLFEAYQQQILNELTLGGDYGAIGPAVAKGVKEREEVQQADTYLFGILKKALNKNADEVAEILTKPLYEILFPGGKFAAIGDQKTQLNKLQNAIQAKMPEVVKKLQEDPELGKQLQKVPGLTSSAKHGYTARILRDFMSPVLQLIEDETPGDEAPTEQEVQSAVTKAVKKKAAEPTPGGAEETPEGEAPEDGGDRTKVRIERMIGDKVDASGVLESDVANDVMREIMRSGGLGIEERSIGRIVKSTINDLIKKRVLERKGQHIMYGDNFETFDTSGSEGSDIIPLEDYISQVTGYGARKTTARGAWGGEGGSSPVDFG